MTGVNWVALTVVIVLFVFVTAVGFAAARWRRAQSMASLDEWGLGGRGFGTRGASAALAMLSGRGGPLGAFR